MKEKLIEAVNKLLSAMEMQEQREEGTFHTNQKNAKAIWDEAKNYARNVINQEDEVQTLKKLLERAYSFIKVQAPPRSLWAEQERLLRDIEEVGLS